MSSKKAARRDDEVPPDADGSLRLQRDLADRERQLRDLTEQSLGFLEELAEARRLNADRERLAVRIGELERQIADLRRQLRHAGGSAPTALRADGVRTPSLAVVFWGEGSLAAAREYQAACDDAVVVWVGPPSALPADFADAALRTIVHRDTGTPAQCWNLALSGTDADAVLLIAPGLVPAGPSTLPDGLAANCALLAPRIDAEAESSIGCVEADAFLRLLPRPLSEPPAQTPSPVPWAAPAAFVVRRAAYEHIGAFDESLLGSASLLDWTLRARRANFEVLATAATSLRGDARALLDDVHDHERLFVLAQHRPEQVAPGLADLDALWRMAPNELAAYLAAILARLPAGDLTAQRSVLDRISIGLVQNSLPGGQVCALVQSSRVALLRSCLDAGLQLSGELEAALRRAEAQAVSPAASAFEALGRDIALCRNAAMATARTLEQTRAERREIDQQRTAQSARADRAEGARATAAQQLEQVQTWLREAQEEQKRLQERRREAEREIAEARQAVQQLRQQADGRDAELAALRKEREGLSTARNELRQECERLAAELDEARARTGQAEQRLAAQLQSHRELEREFLTVDKELRGMHEHTAELARLVGFATGVDRVGMRSRLEFLQQEADKFARTLRQSGAQDERQLLENVAGLARQLERTEQSLREREQWIALLLREVASRRLFPRQLLDHERAFLDHVGKSS